MIVASTHSRSRASGADQRDFSADGTTGRAELVRNASTIASVHTLSHAYSPDLARRSADRSSSCVQARAPLHSGPHAADRRGGLWGGRRSPRPGWGPAPPPNATPVPLVRATPPPHTAGA